METETLKLTNETIDLLSERVSEIYKSVGSSKKDILRAKLILEEALIKYKMKFGDEIDVIFRVSHIFSQTRFTVKLRCPSFDPFTLEENPMAFMISSIMSNFEGAMPSWRYKDLENEIIFTVRKKSKHAALIKLGVAIGFSAILGIILRSTVSANALGSFANNYIEPLTNAYAGIFCIMTVLTTLFGITLSIVNIGDIASVGAFGGKILKRFFLVSTLLTVILLLPTLFFFKISGIGSFNLAAKSIYDILIGFIPTNVVTPFLDFNSIHIIIIGIMFGFSLLTMGQKGETIIKVFDECNMVGIITNNFLNKFITIYVALKIFTVITASDFSKLANAGKMVAIIVGAEILILAFYIAYGCIKSKMSLSKFIRIIMPSFMVCLSSANFSAAFVTVYDASIDLGSDTDTANFTINLGSVVFQPSCTFVFAFSSLFMAQAYGVEITIIKLITVVLLSVILVAAMPNIPGASISVITLLYSQIGLPPEAIALMIAVNAILQFLTVAVDACCLETESMALSLARKKNDIKTSQKSVIK